jgi:hypothetical protein
MRSLLVLLVLSVSSFLSADEVTAPRVDIASSPDGAEVSIDGKTRGVTPLTLFDLRPGRYRVKFRMPGYEDVDRFFKVEDRPFQQIAETLEREKGLLLLKSEPDGCDVAVDGVSRGRTPLLITDLDAIDVHRAVFRKPGYRSNTAEIRFDGRTPLVRTEKLTLDSGIIEVTTEPAGAQVTVNGILRGKTPLKVSDVPKGRATVKLQLEGFADEVRELSMNAGDSQTLSVTLKGLPGTLHIISVPSGARFYVNDEARGSGPLTLSGLVPGEYRVRAELDGYATANKTITLGNGDFVREEIRLSNVMGRLEVRTDPPGAHVLLDGRSEGITKTRDESAEFSDVLAIENVMEGEHVLTVRKTGYSEVTRHPKIQNSTTTRMKIRLKRIFAPDVEIVTDRGRYRGMLVSNTPYAVVVEVSLGIQRSFPRAEIRKINFIKTPDADK